MKTSTIIFILISFVLLFNLAVIAVDCYAGTAFLSGSQTSGLYKICYYNYLGSTIAIYVKSYELCPLTIQVD